MKINWDKQPQLPPMVKGEQNPFVGHFPAHISRFLTAWWWEQGPVTMGPHKTVKNCRCFWERLAPFEPGNPKVSVVVPRNAKPYCCLLNTVYFYSDPLHIHKIAEARHYDFYGISPHLLGDPRTGEWYEVGVAHILWRRGYWWAVFKGWKNTNTAVMFNRA